MVKRQLLFSFLIWFVERVKVNTYGLVESFWSFLGETATGGELLSYCWRKIVCLTLNRNNKGFFWFSRWSTCSNRMYHLCGGDVNWFICPTFFLLFQVLPSIITSRHWRGVSVCRGPDRSPMLNLTLKVVFQKIHKINHSNSKPFFL